MFTKTFFPAVVENTVPVNMNVFRIFREKTTLHKRVLIQIYAVAEFQNNLPRHMYARAEIIGNAFGIFAYYRLIIEKGVRTKT